MKLLVSDSFRKHIPRESKSRIEKIVLRLTDELKNTDQGIKAINQLHKVKKIHGADKIYKFYTDDADRILFACCKDLPNCRSKYSNSIALLDYCSNDEQIRRERHEKSRAAVLLPVQADELQPVGIDRLQPTEIDGFQAAKADLPDPIGMQSNTDRLTDVKYQNFEYDLNRSITYVVQEEDFVKLIDENNEYFEVYLNDEQEECLSAPMPMLLSGSAGSGKTLVGINKLAGFIADYDNLAYFTYTDFLRNKSEQLFGRINAGETDSNTNNVNFFTINGYCMDQLHLLENRFVQYPRFVSWFDENVKKSAASIDINPIDLWGEIRGILKGYMGEEWYRNREFDRELVSQRVLKFLLAEGYIQPMTGNKRYYCNKTMHDFLTLQEELRSSEAEGKDDLIPEIEKIYQKTTGIDFDRKLIDYSTYISLGSDYSVYKEKEKEYIYNIGSRYQAWLDKEGLFDDNDLALSVLEKLRNKEISKFDLIVVDEVQDLTELQIYLIYNLAKDNMHLFFGGDIHQIINPTYFSFGRLKSLFYCRDGKLNDTITLRKNYRSQQKLVELANAMAELRKAHIGSRQLETEQAEIGIRDGSMPFVLKPGQDRLKELIRLVNEKHYAAIVVADEQDREKLLSLLDPGEESGNIFTVSEIKGLEYQYIVCYNLISKFLQNWKDIFTGSARKDSKYRYYFNLFYVSVTRARENLCIYEEDIENPVFEKLGDLFHYVDAVDDDVLNLEGENSSRAAWEQEARRLELNGLYQRAVKYYKKAFADGKNIIRCEAKYIAQEGDYEKAGDMLLGIGEYDDALFFFTQAGNKKKLLKTKIASQIFSFDELDEEFSVKLISEYFAENLDDPDAMKMFSDVYLEQKVREFNKKCSDVSEWLSIL